MTFINESGLYRLIFTSIKPEAEAFKTWVFSEVLPSIRKTGGFGHVVDQEQVRQLRLMNTEKEIQVMNSGVDFLERWRAARR